MKKVCKYEASMIMMGERLENKLFALALYISLINGYVKSGWLDSVKFFSQI